MTVHIGEITSEVGAPLPDTTAEASGEGTTDEWEDRIRLAAQLERLERDRLRTVTGTGDD